jgi:hypothetical protein
VNFQQAFLSAAEQARLDSWAVEIAEEARGAAQDAGNGDWRVGDSRALIIHPGALFYDFTLSKGSRGALALIAFLRRLRRRFDVGAHLCRRSAIRRRNRRRPRRRLHDEIVMEVAIEDADPAAAILKQAMIDGFAETFPGAPLKGTGRPAQCCELGRCQRKAKGEMTMAMTPLKRPTLDELVAPLLVDGLPLPAPLRWALDQDPQPLAPSTRTAWPEWAHGHGYSVEQIAILKACIGKRTHSGPYLKSVAADLSGRHDVNGELVQPLSLYDRHSATLTLHIRALAKAAEQRSEKTSPPSRAFKPQPETAPPVMPPQPV